jgi:hypothetical protein
MTQLTEFQKVYRVGWSLREPWERQNLGHFFFLEALVRKKQIDNAFYGDGDVAVVAALNATIRPAQCDGLVSLGRTDNLMATTYHWSAWAGSVILSQIMLADFARVLL